jgi:hypothetical protein
LTERAPLEKKETEEPPQPIEEQTVAPLSEEKRMILYLSDMLKEQNAKIARMEAFLDPKKFDEWLQTSLMPLVQTIQKRFEANEARMAQGAPTQSGGTGGFVTEIFKVVEKGLDRIGTKPAASGFAQEAQSMFEDIIKLDLKEMLRARRSQMGLPPPETHIILQGR